MTKLHFITNCKLDPVVIFSFLILFITYFSFSLILPTFEEPDAWNHFLLSWSYFKGVSADVPTLDQPPLYFFINGMILNFLDPNTLNQNAYLHDPPEFFPFRGIELAFHLMRFSSIIYGLVSLFFIYKISKLIFYKDRWLPIFCLLSAGFLPIFLYSSTTIMSESLATMLSIISIFILLKIFQNPENYKCYILLGIFCGLAILTKLTAFFLIPFVIFSFIYIAYSKRPNRKIFLISISFFFIFLMLSGGWWYTQDSQFFYLLSLSNSPFESTSTGISIMPEKVLTRLSDFDGLNKLFFTGFLFPTYKLDLAKNFSWFFTFPLLQITSLMSFVGLMYVFSRRGDEYKTLKPHLFILVLSVIFPLLLVMIMIMIVGDVFTRNILPAIGGLSVLYGGGLFYFVRKPKLKIFLFLIVIIFVSINIIIFNDLANKNHFVIQDRSLASSQYLILEMWSGVGSTEFPFPAIVHTRTLENGKPSQVAILHVPKDGQKWLNFTMTVPEKQYLLGIDYGLLKNSKGRELPIEFSMYFDGSLLFQQEKSFTGKISTDTVDLTNYLGKTINVSLSTDAKGTSIYKGWAFMKLHYLNPPNTSLND